MSRSHANLKTPSDAGSTLALGSRGNRIASFLLSVCMLTQAACSRQPQRPAPPTYPVTGTLTAPDGRSLVGACVEFKTKQNETELTATGVVDADGKFSLQIPYVDRVIPGATAGPHAVFVVMPLGVNHKGAGYVAIKGNFEVQPTENHFEIILTAK